MRHSQRLAPRRCRRPPAGGRGSPSAARSSRRWSSPSSSARPDCVTGSSDMPSGVKSAGTEFGAFQSASPPTTSAGLRMSSTAAASPRGSRQDSDVGVAPSFQTAKLVSKKALPLGRPMATKSPAFTPLGGKGAGAAVGAAFELLPGQRVLAMADRNRVLWLAIGVPARHVGDRNEHLTPPTDGFSQPFYCPCGVRRDASRPRSPAMVVTQGGRGVYMAEPKPPRWRRRLRADRMAGRPAGARRGPAKLLTILLSHSDQGPVDGQPQ